jgi:hypothetical protein
LFVSVFPSDGVSSLYGITTFVLIDRTDEYQLCLYITGFKSLMAFTSGLFGLLYGGLKAALAMGALVGCIHSANVAMASRLGIPTPPAVLVAPTATGFEGNSNDPLGWLPNLDRTAVSGVKGIPLPFGWLAQNHSDSGWLPSVARNHSDGAMARNHSEAIAAAALNGTATALELGFRLAAGAHHGALHGTPAAGALDRNALEPAELPETPWSNGTAHVAGVSRVSSWHLHSPLATIVEECELPLGWPGDWYTFPWEVFFFCVQIVTVWIAFMLLPYSNDDAVATRSVLKDLRRRYGRLHSSTPSHRDATSISTNAVAGVSSSSPCTSERSASDAQAQAQSRQPDERADRNEAESETMRQSQTWWRSLFVEEDEGRWW